MTNKRRTVNYGSENTPETEALHRMIRAVLAVNPNMRASEIAKAVGRSRTGIQYHLRKMAYAEQIDMMLRPHVNGQLAFVCRLRYHVRADAIAA